MTGRRRLHRTPRGIIDSRAFQLERDTFRAEIQREGEPLAVGPGTVHTTLRDAWIWAERSVQNQYPHNCDEMSCGHIRLAAG
jgi:hypothetical protein